MSQLLDILLWLIAVAIGLPTVVLVVQCAVAVLGRVRAGPAGNAEASRTGVAVLVPAHNEQAGIAATIAGLRPQLAARDRLLVVADNCTDATAERARAAGAEVVERHDPRRRGKGHALAFGVEHLRADPPDVLIVIDADCRAEPGTIQCLARLVSELDVPHQALDLLDTPPVMPARLALSQLAFVVKNHVRPTGLQRLGLPCPLMGTGMAIPFHALRQINLATDHLSEDMRLGVELVIRGYPARFCPEAKVFSPMTADTGAAFKQRTRWEQGHVHTSLTQTPRLLYHALRYARPRLLAVAADLLVPPLAMLSLLTLAALLITAGAAAAGATPWPAVITAASVGLLGATVILAWARFGRARVPGRALLAIPVYMLWKVPIYIGFIVRRQRAWVRADRATEGP